MLEAKQPASILERIQNVYQEYPLRFWVLMTGTFIDRLGTNLIMPFLAIYVLQRFDTKITQVGLICTLFAIGSGLGNFLAGALADRFGRRFTLILGLVCAATARIAHGLANTFFVALIVFSKLPETQPDKGSGSSGENFAQTLAGYKRTLQDGIFVAFVLISILTVTVYMQMSTTLSVYLVKFQHVSESFFGTLVMLNALMVVFLQFSISRWASRQPLLIIMIAGTAFYLVGFGSYGLPPSIPLFIFAMILITLGEMLVIPTSQALTALLAHSGYARPLCGNGAPQLDHCSIAGSGLDAVSSARPALSASTCCIFMRASD